MAVNVPEVEYAKSGAVAIAYQISGGGPVDIVLVTGFVANILYAWEQPAERQPCHLARAQLGDEPLSGRPLGCVVDQKVWPSWLCT